MALQEIVISSAIGLFFALGWYFNVKLEAVHKKLDRVLEAIDSIKNPNYNEP